MISKDQVSYLDLLIEQLQKKGVDVFFHSKLNHLINDEYSFNQKFPVLTCTEDLLCSHIDLLLSVGGDGTMLHSALLAKDSGIPMLGINLGRLGFLAIVEKNMIQEAVGKLVEGQYTIESRSLLQLNTEPQIFPGENIALNDCTVHKSLSPSVITVRTFLNDKFLSSYWVDGLIVSTQTGSTGYSLSCGGPILFPGTDAFIITPVAPHNLTMRPIVVPGDSVLRLEIESRSEKIMCSLDSRYEQISCDHHLTIQKSAYEVKLLVFAGLDFSYSIQNKLNWGTDRRN